MIKLNDVILKQQGEYYDSYLKIKNNPRYKKIWSYIFENYKNNIKVLDIGCTNGDFSVPLIKKGFDCYGIDYIDKAIRESRSKGVKVLKSSFLERLPFRSGFFDIVFAGEVIEHTIDDESFLKEINRVLKPGGLLILTTPNLVSLGNRVLMFMGRLPRFAYNEFHYRIYNSALIKSKLAKTDFSIVRFDSSYILISTFFNKALGMVGEWLGSIIPYFGENFVIFATKNKEDNSCNITSHANYYSNNIAYLNFIEKHNRYAFKKYISFIKKYLVSNGIFLDVGCGGGRVLELIKRSKLRGIGIDVSNIFIKACISKGLDSVLFDGKKIPFKNESFDMVGSFNVLEHVDNPDLFLNEQVRVLKENGYLIIVCPNFLSISNSFHWHTKGITKKISNLFMIIMKIFSTTHEFEKMETLIRKDLHVDDDACNITNPIDILKWAKKLKLDLIYWSSQEQFVSGLRKTLDVGFLKLFLGASFLVFKKNNKTFA
jgi:2-polyprenyl-3-methyl-5-hydroxy-6-metoxy-1,4-benzoquinol methylase